MDALISTGSVVINDPRGQSRSDGGRGRFGVLPSRRTRVAARAEHDEIPPCLRLERERSVSGARLIKAATAASLPG